MFFYGLNVIITRRCLAWAVQDFVVKISCNYDIKCSIKKLLQYKGRAGEGFLEGEELPPEGSSKAGPYSLVFLLVG